MTDPAAHDPAATATATAGAGTDTRSVSWFDAAGPADATAALRPICASPRWAGSMLANRPFGSLAAMTASSRAALAVLTRTDLDEALTAHPRIGQRADGQSTEARWSRAEQSAAATPDAAVTERLRAANVEYEDRFGFVFLICAAGRGAEEILRQLQARMSNDPDTELAVLRSELSDIVDLRLARAFTDIADPHAEARTS